MADAVNRSSGGGWSSAVRGSHSRHRRATGPRSPIYVGYRYFDSFYKTIDPANPETVVDYPFGYGLSYTDFAIKTQNVKADMGTLTVTAKVTNTGAVAGKEVAEIYVSAPQTGLDKPYQQLAGYAKTDELAPGTSQVVTIAVDTASLASYDPVRAARVLSAGDYLVRVGDSSRGTEVAARVRLAQEQVVEQLNNELTDQAPASQLTSSPANFYSYPDEAKQIATACVVPLDTRGFVTKDSRSAYEQNVTVGTASPYYALDGSPISSTTALIDPAQTAWENTGAPYQPKVGESVKSVSTRTGITLYDVAQGRATMDQLVASLSVNQLATIVEGANAKGSTLSAVGAAGYTTARYENLGILAMTLSDGPAGLRLTQQIATTPTSCQFGTAWPVGTLLAQTWNRDLLQQVGTAIGKEMTEYGVTLWLAPGMNIHRDPLNGRNFEYFSEDPLVTGLTAAAETLGVQSNPGVGVTIKHFAANNQETLRNTTNAVIGERALREVYLRGFEIAVKTAQPMAVMTSYNLINGTHTAGSYGLVTDVLRGEWGFKGLVMTDWGSVNQTGVSNTQYAGNDLIMPGNNPSQVINTILTVPPTVDVNGLPVYNRTINGTRTSWTWQLGGITLLATGSQTFSTTVDASSNLTAVPASGTTTVDPLNNQVFTPLAPYGSVDAAYASVTSLLSGTALTAAQKAGITVSDVQHQNAADPTSPVVSYKVTLRGDYPAAGTNLRLGDLQRSAAHILGVVMKTSEFAQLAKIQGVAGIDVGGYSAGVGDLASVVSVSTDKVTGPAALAQK